MGFEIVDAAIDQARRVEDAVAPVHHVIVERKNHQRRIGDDATELARVERVESHRLARAQRAQGRQHLVGAQRRKLDVRGRHTPTLTSKKGGRQRS